MADFDDDYVSHWHNGTLAGVTACFKEERHKAWSDAIESGKLNEFSETLESLLDRLSGILASEVLLKLDELGWEKLSSDMVPIVRKRIQKFLDMAALAGKTL